MPSERTQLGNRGEALAAAHLEAAGYEIIDRNYRTRYGEIDLIARDGDALVFVEVRTKWSALFGEPEESITPRKFERMAHVAQQYLEGKGLEQAGWRIDLIAISMQAHQPRITHIQAISA